MLVGVPPDKAVDHLAALEAAGLDAVVVERPRDVEAVAAVAAIVAPITATSGGSGLVAELVERFPSVPVVALAERVTLDVARTAARWGAVAVVGLDEPVGEAAEAVLQVSVGFGRFPGWLLRELTSNVPGLTDTEVGWLELLGDDTLTMADIAKCTGWSRAELYRRLRPLYRSLDAANRREAVLRARQAGILR